MKYDIAAYVWPSYTGDEPRARMFWPEGYGEWQSVKNAVPKFSGHDWPRRPLWGYVNEADPYVMEMQIEAATDHGVNVFIYDWYWYDKRPFLEHCLNNGFLKAKNNRKMKFYLMWANHDVTNVWDIRLSGQDNLIWSAAVDRSEVERITYRLIEKYFCLPNYYKIDGKPVFMLYNISNFIQGLGGIKQAQEAVDWMREACVKAGLPGLHLQFTMRNENALNLSGVDGCKTLDVNKMISLLGFDSMSHYQFHSFVDIDRDYLEMLPDVQKEWNRIDNEYDIVYFPHISLGWDNNPRFIEFRPGIVKNATPASILKGFEMAKKYVDGHPNQPPLITVNSWNEWTETSYLQPDDLYGYGYLNAIKSLFMQNTD